MEQAGQGGDETVRQPDCVGEWEEALTMLGIRHVDDEPEWGDAPRCGRVKKP